MTFTDKALIGEDVKNTVTVTSDNTDPAGDSNTVKVTKPDKPDKTDKSKDTSDKSGGSKGTSGGSNKGSGSVQTSDILIGILIAAVIIFVVASGVSFYKKKKAAKGNTGLKL